MSARHFVIAGAQRCGTTYLYRLLEEHPDVEMARPLTPEPKFFLDPACAEKGLEGYLGSYFGHHEAPAIRGEKGTSYIESEDAAERIAAILPEPSVVVLVRDPIQRAISNYRFSVHHGLERSPIEEALTPEAEERRYDRGRISASPYVYLRRGRYIDYLTAYERHIPRDRLHVVLFEELVDGDAYEGLLAALGLAPHRPATLGTVVNAAETPAQELSPEHLARLRAYYAEPTRALADWLGRSLQIWS